MHVEVTAKRAAEILLAPVFKPEPEQLRADPRRRTGELMTELGRPGRGGRRRKSAAGSQTSATAELRKLLGESVVKGSHGASVEIWEVNKAGTVVVGARLSSEDVQKGENVMAQVQGALDLCEQEGLVVRYVIAATRMSGDRKKSERLDLEFILDAIDRGHVDSVIYREVDRLARNVGVADGFYRHLEEKKTDLYFTVTRRKIDWELDRLMLQVQGGMADQERRLIGRRTSSALRRRLLETGKGWPGSVRFGFMRARDQTVVVDPDQWPFVERIHHDYSKIGKTGRGSLRKLSEHMEELGCRFTPTTLGKILRDEIYVTGEWNVTVKGETFPGKTIELSRPIPPEVFVKNAALLENTNGKNSITPYGAYLLNTVPTFHARCMDQQVLRKHYGTSNMTTPRLRGKRYGDDRAKRPPGYCHDPRTPETCRGYSVSAEILEGAVISALLNLADSKELQEAYIARASEGIEYAGAKEDVGALRRQVAQIKDRRRQTVREFVDGHQGDVAEAPQVNLVLESLDADIQALTLRLDNAVIAEKTRRKAGKNDLRTELERVLRIGHDATDEQRQRRVALVSTLLSKVVVHDTTEGFDVELFGHLIPTGRQMTTADFADHVETAVSESREPSSKRTLSGRFASRWGEVLDEKPSWQSERISVAELPFEHNQLDAVRRCFEVANRHAQPGRLFRKAGNAKSPYDLVRLERPQLLRENALARVCREHGKTRDSYLRECLEPKRALRLGRFAPNSEQEIRLTIRWALKDGMTLDPGWVMRWDSCARSRPYLETYSSLRERLQDLGKSFKVVVYEVAMELGLPYRMPRKKEIPDRSTEIEHKTTLLVQALPTTDLAAAGYTRGRLIKLRKAGKLFYLRVPLSPIYFYPSWQFDSEMQVDPFAQKAISLLAELGVEHWDLERTMQTEVEYRGKPMRLDQIVPLTEADDWLPAHLRYRLKAAALESDLSGGRW